MAAEGREADSMLKSLRSVVQEVTGAHDLPETLAIIVRRVREAMGTEVCCRSCRNFRSGRTSP
jgi:phosphotransferase system enzyme I (PtsP)